jgi:hypothetical protein
MIARLAGAYTCDAQLPTRAVSDHKEGITSTVRYCSRGN